MIRYLFQQDPVLAHVVTIAGYPVFLVISIYNYMANRKNAGTIEDFVNFNLVIIAVIAFIPWIAYLSYLR